MMAENSWAGVHVRSESWREGSQF